jgi:copper(I)-binding protein
MLRKLIAGLVALLAVTCGVGAQSPAKPGVVVEEVWARATPGNAQSGVAYLNITNTGTTPDRLLSVSSTVAEKTELHENKTEDGVMKMRPEAPVALKPGETVTLKPGGDHLMLMGLKQPLKEGDSIPLTLLFEKAGAIQVTAKVAKVGAMRAGDGGMENMDHGAMPHGNQ